MGTLELFPDTLIAETAAGTFQLTGGASSTAVLSDGSDATYLRGNGSGIGTGTYSGTWLLGPLTGLPAGAVVTGVQLKMRYSNMSPEIWEPTNVRVVRATSGAYSALGFTKDESIVFAPGTGSTVREWLGPLRDKTVGGSKYLWELLAEPGARLAASVDLNRYVASNTARLLSFSAVVTYNEPATVTILTPTGTEVVSRPTWTWRYADPENDRQRSYDLRVFTEAQTLAADFSPETTTPVYRSYEVTSATVHKATKSFGASGNYVAYLRTGGPVMAGNNLISAWATQAFTLSLATPTAPTPDATYNPATNAIDVTAAGADNQLSYNQSTMERSSDGGWHTGVGASGAYSTTVAQQGTYSLRMTRGSGTADTSMFTGSGSAADAVPVTPGDPISVLANVRAGTTGRTVRVGVAYHDASRAALGSIVYGTSASDNSSGWTQLTYTGTVPAGAVWARLVVTVNALPAGEFHYIDRAGMWPAAGVTPWQVGGYAMDTRTVDLQRSLDAGATWEDVPDSLVVHDPRRQTIAYTDGDLPSGVTATYRLRVTAPNDLGEPMTSGWSATDSASMPAFTSWWLTDTVTGESMPVDVWDFKAVRPMPGTLAYPLPSDDDEGYPVWSHDGMKAPVLTMSVWLLDRQTYERFHSIADSGNVLLLRDVLGNRWWGVVSNDLPEQLLAAQATAAETTPIRHAHQVETFTLATVGRPAA